MNRKRIIFRRFLLICILLFLLMIAWWTIDGGLRQISHTSTFGQQVETIVQLACGLLSLLTIFTTFLWRKWALPVRAAWAISLVATASLSSLVWGPPMPFIALVFGAVALMAALIILWSLKRLSNGTINTSD